jgi:hypothetical protein
MISKKSAILLFAVLLFTAAGSSAVISNSNDWRDSSIALAYSHFTDENFHAVTSYSEANIVAAQVGNTSHTVLESDDPVWEGYEDKLRNEGAGDVTTRDMQWESSQYELYSDVEDQVEGFVVLEPGYGIDTISVFPKIVGGNYWPIYYDGESTESFLKGKDKPVLFYGEILRQPWKKLEGEKKVIAEGTKERNNRRIVNDLFREFRSEEVMVTGDQFLEKGSLKKGNPIIVDQSVEQAAEIINRYDVSFVEVIGGANVNFGTSLENNLDDDITVIAKFGRKFTGVGGQGSTYPLKKIPVTPVERDISLQEVKFDRDNSGMTELVFSNDGTIPTMLNFTAVSLERGDRSRLVSNSESVLLRPERNTTIEFRSNLSFAPESSRVSFTYRGSSGLNDNQRPVRQVDESSLTEVELKDLYYYEPAEEIVLELENTGDEDAWFSGQVQGLQTMNRSVAALTEEQKQIEAGSSAKLRVSAYLTEEQREANSQVDVAVTYGESEGYAVDYRKFSNVNMSVKEATLADIAVTYGIPLIILLIIILLFLYFRRRKKMKKELRGLT